MSDYKEIIHERLYVKVPGGDRLRKNAAARQKHLLANGWRETERTQNADYIQVRFERTGHAPLKARLPEEGAGDPRPAPASSRQPRRPGRASVTSSPRSTEYPSVFGVRIPDVFRVSWLPPMNIRCTASNGVGPCASQANARRCRHERGVPAAAIERPPRPPRGRTRTRATNPSPIPSSASTSSPTGPGCPAIGTSPRSNGSPPSGSARTR